MGKNRKQASLTNVVQYDSNFNLSIGSSTSSSFNSSGSIIAASGFTGSLSGSVFGLGNTVSFSSSVSSDLVNLESKSASVDISITNINSFTASNANQSLNQLTGSLATTGSNSFYGTQVFSGSVYIANDLVVQGSSSIQYISASSVSIGTNIVQLNTANPSVRFAGLTIIDSGSVGGSGSFLYDSLQDEFIFIHRGNGTNITSSHFVLGPETYDSLGNETYLTTNILSKGTGKEHLVDSCIFDNGTTICIKNNLVTTGTACFTNSIIATQSTNGEQALSVINTNSGACAAAVFNLQNDTNSSQIVYTSSTYTGVYGCGANAINIINRNSGPINFLTAGYSSAAIRMAITNCGIVGIGIISPVADDGNLVVAGAIGTGQGTANTVAQINIWETTSGNKSGLWFGSMTNANTGIIGSRTATGNIAFQTYCGGWAERMRIAYNGNVGMGTNNPSDNLHIVASEVGNVGISIQNTNASYSSQLRFLNCAGTEKAAVTFVQSTNSLNLNVNQIDGLIISCTGVSSFSSCVAGNSVMNITNTSPTGQGITLTAGDDYNSYALKVLDYAGVEKLRLDGNGNLLVGYCTDAGYKFGVNGTSIFSGAALFQSSVTATSMTVATDCSGVIVDVAGRHGLMKYFNYGTGLIGACSSTDGGISMWMGRFAGTITSPTAVYQDLKILNSGIATFSCKIDTPGLTMGSIAHHQNYRNTSGCFAIFCASQGAVLYVTSMHNNGRSTAIINYANGVTGGASYSLLNQATPYGPAALGFALCANGWLYAHHYYGGPMDFYAIQIGGTFTWAF